MNLVKVIPAILADNVSQFREEVDKCIQVTNRIQLDVIDGVFAARKTVGLEYLDSYSEAEWDIHLMVSKPEQYLGHVRKAGVKRVFGQIEEMDSVTSFVADGQALGLEIGLAFGLETDLEPLAKIIDDVDAVLLMGAPMGEQGGGFDQRVLARIKRVREWSKRVPLVIDGGLDEEKIKWCIAAEWDEEMREDELDYSFAGMEFVVGSHLLKAENIQNEWTRLTSLVVHE